jgi:hypothetical protein
MFRPHYGDAVAVNRHTDSSGRTGKTPVRVRSKFPPVFYVSINVKARRKFIKINDNAAANSLQSVL